MSASQENSRERSQRAIDVEIKSLEASIRALRLRRNALSSVSSLPPEVFALIFSLLCLPALGRKMSDYHQGRLRVSHVCHRWREIALNQPFLWSNVDLTALNLAGLTEVFARAKSVPLCLKAKVSGRRWNDFRFNEFQKELQACVPNACHLSISAELVRLHNILGGLVSPAPTLKYLSLFSRGVNQNMEAGSHLFVPDTLFNGSAPRLSCLKLFNCKISWNSPLLKGHRHLEMHSPIPRPRLAAWLDALNEMLQLKTLVLHSASPIAPQGDGDVKHNATLPSLTHLEILASPADCALALAHLDLPALTGLSLTISYLPSRNDLQALLPHLTRHAHGPQDTQPLQSVLLHGEGNGAKILAWPISDIDVKVQDPPVFLATTLPSPRVALFFTSHDWSGAATRLEILDAAMAALPLDGLDTLLVRDFAGPPDKSFWLCHAPKWPLLRRVQLEACAQHGFTEMLLEGKIESPLLPLLTELVLVGCWSNGWPSALRRRAEQGVPLELLDLRMYFPHSPVEVQLLSNIVVDTLGPEYEENTSKIMGRMISRWNTVVRGHFTEKITNFETYEGLEDRSDENHESWRW